MKYAAVVCLSVTLWYCIKMAKLRIMKKTKPYDSPGTLVSDGKDYGKVRSHSRQGRQMQVG